MSNCKNSYGITHVKLVIDPAFEFLRAYLSALPEKFDERGKVIHEGRNVIRQDEAGPVKLVIKSYRRIYLANRIRYTYFYPSKAQRAFDHAQLLLEKNIQTPRPIAYLEYTEGGLLKQSFFVSEYTGSLPLSAIFKMKVPDLRALLMSFARFTYQLHQQNIYHVDYSIGNILFLKNGHGYEFSLIDNNRMHFGPINYLKGIRNLERLGLPVEILAYIAKEYARLRGIHEIIAVERLFHYHRNRLMRVRAKEWMKDVLKRLNVLAQSALPQRREIVKSER